MWLSDDETVACKIGPTMPGVNNRLIEMHHRQARARVAFRCWIETCLHRKLLLQLQRSGAYSSTIICLHRTFMSPPHREYLHSLPSFYCCILCACCMCDGLDTFPDERPWEWWSATGISYYWWLQANQFKKVALQYQFKGNGEKRDVS